MEPLAKSQDRLPFPHSVFPMLGHGTDNGRQKDRIQPVLLPGSESIRKHRYVKTAAM